MKLTRSYRLLLKGLNDLMQFPLRLAKFMESKRIQRTAIRDTDLQHKKELVVFFIPGFEGVTGGVLQIYSLHRLTRETICNEYRDAIICWLPVPRNSWYKYKFAGFDNNVVVHSLEMLLSAIDSDCKLLFHIPEFRAPCFCNYLGWERIKKLRDEHALKVNILNQNIERLPDVEFFSRLKQIIPDLTCTVGNPAWASTQERKLLGVPLHVLPTWYYPDNAPWQPFETKSNLMIVSPDANPNRELVLTALRDALPDLTIKVITGLKYEQYLELERSAKWSLTFGEGFDGYFYGPVLRGGISFAVRNGTFDLPGFENCRTLYPSYESMAQNIVDEILKLDNKQSYEAFNLSIRMPITKVFSQDHTANALTAFYKGEWSYP